MLTVLEQIEKGELLTVEEVAAKVKRTPKTVREWIREGTAEGVRLQAVRVVSRSMVSLAALAKFLVDSGSDGEATPASVVTAEELSERKRIALSRVRAK